LYATLYSDASSRSGGSFRPGSSSPASMRAAMCSATCSYDDLAELRHHYGSAYIITRPRPDVWIAQRRDTRETLRADSPAELLDRIRADYAERPVSRRITGADRPQASDCRFRPEG
jgi:hypothetical protein